MDVVDRINNDRHVSYCMEYYLGVIKSFDVDLQRYPQLKIAIDELDSLIRTDKPAHAVKVTTSQAEVIEGLDSDLGLETRSGSLEAALLAHARETTKERRSVLELFRLVLSYHNRMMEKHSRAIEAFGIDLDRCPKLDDLIRDITSWHSSLNENETWDLPQQAQQPDVQHQPS